jgi:hypothetical protein
VGQFEVGTQDAEEQVADLALVTQLSGQPRATIPSVRVVKKVTISPSAVKDSPSACLQNDQSPADFIRKAVVFFGRTTVFPKNL